MYFVVEKRPPEHMRKARFQLIQYGLAMNLIAENYERRDISNEIERPPASSKRPPYH